MDKNNLDKKEIWWKPVMVFYAKTTSWIIFPLILGFFGGKYFRESTGSQILFFILIFFGFMVTCFGIWREIREYKKDLEKIPPSHKATDGQEENAK